MKTTAKKIATVVGIGALVILAFFFFLAVERGKGTPTEQVFQPPVYESGVPDGVLASPLFLDTDETGSVISTPDVEKIISTFKQKVLIRIASPKLMSDTEKSIIEASISTSEKPSVGALVLANQTVLHFTTEEIARIESALTK